VTGRDMGDKISVLHIIYSFFPSYSGGRETLLNEVIKQSNFNPKIDLTVVSFPRSKEPSLVVFKRTFVHRILAIPQIVRIYYIATLMNMLLLAFKSLKEARRRNIRIVHVHNPGGEAISGLLLKRAFKTKLVVHVHGYVEEELSETLPLLSPYWSYIYRTCLKKADVTVFVSQRLVEHALKKGIHMKKAVVIMPGIDQQRFSPQGWKYKKHELLQQAGLTSSQKIPIIVAQIASIRPLIKGQDITIKAASIVVKNFPHTYFIFVGKGNQKTLQQMAEALGVNKNVGFLGERRDVPEILRSVDIIVNPSRFEGLPLALLEAMACGKPIIATDVGGVKDLIRHGLEGLLIHPSDKELAKAIFQLIQDGNLTRRLSKMARQRAEEYEWKIVVEKLFALYDELS
jgi:glycosyltransferase involved in cell wall biosynthesis